MNLRILHVPILALITLVCFTQNAKANRDLETGTFLTRDPTGFVDGPNVYNYVRQNPWTYFDPDGLQRATAEDRIASQTGHSPLVFGDEENHVKLSTSENGAVHYMGGKGDVAPVNALEARAVEVMASGGHPENFLAMGKEAAKNGPFALMAANSALIRAGAEATKFEKAWAEATPYLASVGGGVVIIGKAKPSATSNSVSGTTAKSQAKANVENTGGQRTQGTRYVGEGEAAVIEKTGRVPNTNAAGDPKVVYYTHDKPLNSATDAQAAYKLPSKPTHRVTVDTRSSKPGTAGNVEGGTGIELTTDRSLPVKGKPKKLGE